MKVLVTGGAGFIGSHLAERLLGEGDEVVALDDLSTGSRANVAHLGSEPRFELRVGSAADDALVGELAARCDAVVHLAAAVGVRLVVERPVHAIETNVLATRAVLAAAAREGKRVVLASSSEVYGKSGRAPFREDDDLRLGPTSLARWSYACSKALDEWLALAYAAERGLPVTAVRLFNVVGPRQTGRYGMVLPRFAEQALECRPITVHGDGHQTRCFAHVADAALAIARLLRCEEAEGEVVNVGSDEEVSIRDLAERVRALAGSESEIATVPYAEAYGAGFEDLPRRVPDLAKLERLTGFRPRIPLERSIRDVLEDARRSTAARRPEPERRAR